MGRAFRIAAVAATSCVATVHGVSAFAQTDTAPRPTVAFERTAFGAAREYVAAELVAHPHAIDVVPANLLVPRIYLPLLQSMLRRSPTFRRQCLRVADASHLSVRLELASNPFARTARARTRIVRHPGRLTATIVIAQRDDVVELIAHEMEHVIEQLDEVDLASKAALPDSGVKALDNGGLEYETTRAHRIGLRVAEEVRRARQTGS